ncbi:MAG: hypothetical protein ICV62_15785 [Cyanobacteria bacterium Co-bin13]|nr:hypothetical protein [Cyanobacteria bacterium Co-bin13]
MNIILTATAIGLVTVMGAAGFVPAAMAQPAEASPCDGVNFVESGSGECIDLTRLTGTREATLTAQFYTALGRLSIPVLHKDCDSEKTLGYYDLSSNEMVLCMNNLKDDYPEIEATLIHESWHVVQDCEDGLDNASYRPMSLRHGDFANLDLMASSLERADLRTIENHYNPEDRPHEIEARYMEHHPDLVLQGLNACAIRQ